MVAENHEIEDRKQRLEQRGHDVADRWMAPRSGEPGGREGVGTQPLPDQPPEWPVPRPRRLVPRTRRDASVPGGVRLWLRALGARQYRRRGLGYVARHGFSPEIQSCGVYPAAVLWGRSLLTPQRMRYYNYRQ